MLTLRTCKAGWKKERSQPDQAGITVSCIEPDSTWSCPAYSLFSISLNNSNDGLGNMLLEHTANAKPGRAARGEERITRESGEKQK